MGRQVWIPSNGDTNFDGRGQRLHGMVRSKRIPWQDIQDVVFASWCSCTLASLHAHER